MLLWSALALWDGKDHGRPVWRKHRLGMGQEEMAGERHSEDEER